MSCCPECSEIVIDEGNPLYVICSGEDCPMHYIPKNESLLDEVLSYCTSLDECLNCTMKIYSLCMPHTNKYFICYKCHFKNPHTYTYDLDIKKFLHGNHGDFPKCTKCNLYFDNYKYGEDECIFCSSEYDYDYYGVTFKEIPVDSYEEVNFSILGFDYLNHLIN